MVHLVHNLLVISSLFLSPVYGKTNHFSPSHISRQLQCASLSISQMLPGKPASMRLTCRLYWQIEPVLKIPVTPAPWMLVDHLLGDARAS